MSNSCEKLNWKSTILFWDLYKAKTKKTKGNILGEERHVFGQIYENIQTLWYTG